MEYPNNKGNATPERLREYALWRKEDELKDITAIKFGGKDTDIIENHEDYRTPLAIEIEKTVKVQLSWGGDGDGFKFYFEKGENLPYKGLYYWEDWGCYEEVNLTDTERDLVADYYGVSEMI